MQRGLPVGRIFFVYVLCGQKDCDRETIRESDASVLSLPIKPFKVSRELPTFPQSVWMHCMRMLHLLRGHL